MAAILLVVAASGCSSPAAVRPSPTPSLLLTSPRPSGELAPGWTRVTDAPVGFSIGLPDSWDRAIADSPTFAADLAAAGGRNGDLHRFFADAFTNSKDHRLRLLAADPRSADSGFATNLNIMVTDLGDPAHAPSLNDLAGAKLKHLRAEADVVQPVRDVDRHIPAGDTVEIKYSLKIGDKTASVTSYLVVDDRGSTRRYFELTMATTSTQQNDLFAEFIDSFQVMAPPPQPTPSPAASASPPP